LSFALFFSSLLEHLLSSPDSPQANFRAALVGVIFSHGQRLRTRVFQHYYSLALSLWTLAGLIAGPKIARTPFFFSKVCLEIVQLGRSFRSLFLSFVFLFFFKSLPMTRGPPDLLLIPPPCTIFESDVLQKQRQTAAISLQRGTDSSSSPFL